MGCFGGVRHWIEHAGLLHLVAKQPLGLIDVRPLLSGRRERSIWASNHSWSSVSIWLSARCCIVRVSAGGMRSASRAAKTMADDAKWRYTCMEQRTELRRSPMLKTLALRCVTYDEPAKRLVLRAELVCKQGRSRVRKEPRCER